MWTQHPVARVGALLILCASIACGREDFRPFSPTRQTRVVRAAAGDGEDLRLFVDRGSAAEAADYAHHVARMTGFPAGGSLDQLLGFCGFRDATGRLLETEAPADIERRWPGRTLTLRYFAPGLADLSNVGGPAASKAIGWRKLVRLAIDPGSPAGRNGLDAAYFLFNVFQDRKDLAADPFGGCATEAARCAERVHVMLVPRAHVPGADAAFWLTFLATPDGGRRGDHVLASFDGGDHAARRTPDTRQALYLPGACAQCHGGSAAEARLTFLDTDHWEARLRTGNDYADLQAAADRGALIDAGVDPQSPAYAAVFATARQLNTHVRAQNASVADGDFHVRAVDRWLGMHSGTAAPATVMARALATPGGETWADTPQDRELLPLLDRYCYRCHSSIGFNVFDKEAVLRRQRSMARRTELGPLRPGGMPLDRTLDADTSARLAQLLRELR